VLGVLGRDAIIGWLVRDVSKDFLSFNALRLKQFKKNGLLGRSKRRESLA
jgi:hypothetical protein